MPSSASSSSSSSSSTKKKEKEAKLEEPSTTDEAAAPPSSSASAVAPPIPSAPEKTASSGQGVAKSPATAKPASSTLTSKAKSKSGSSSSSKNNHGTACRTIAQLGPHDVLCGRGGATNTHAGNKRFREIVAQHQAAYVCARRAEKMQISQTIVSTVMEQGGRFWQQVVATTTTEPEDAAKTKSARQDNNDSKTMTSFRSTSQWIPASRDVAIRKTSQALREGMKVREIKDKLKQNNNSGSASSDTSDAAQETTRLLLQQTKQQQASLKTKIPVSGPSSPLPPKTKYAKKNSKTSNNNRHQQDDPDDEDHEPTKYLEDYTSAEVAALVEAKGSSFAPLATTLREADVPGNLIASLLVQRPGALDEFLANEAECHRKILRSSVVASFLMIPTRLTAPMTTSTTATTVPANGLAIMAASGTSTTKPGPATTTTKAEAAVDAAKEAIKQDEK